MGIKDINVDLIKANLAQNRSLDDCDIVNEYRSEGLLGSVKANCTPEEKTQIKRDFFNCSYSIVEVVETLGNLTLINLNKIICDTIQNVTTSCKGLLGQCSGLTDRDQIYSAQMENIKTYIQDKLNVSDTVAAVDLCKLSAQVEAGMDLFNDVVNSAKEIKKALVDGNESSSQQQQIGVHTSGVWKPGFSLSIFLPWLLLLQFQ